MMKKFGSLLLTKIKNFGLMDILTIGLLIFIAVWRGPQIFSNFQLQSAKVEPVNVERLSGELVSFPTPNTRQVVVFWFTTCGPCKVEMNKLSKLVSEGIIRAENILAVNSYEDADVVREFLKDNAYPFIFAQDKDGLVAEKFKVNSTPTILFIDADGTVQWATSGLTPSLEFRITRFFQSKT